MPDEKPKLLEGNERIVVQSLMPISLIWHDFLAKHEYIDNETMMMVSVDQVMNLVKETTEYIYNVYKRIGVTQEQFDEIANEITPLLYPQPEEPPHPDKNGDNPPTPAKVT